MNEPQASMPDGEEVNNRDRQQALRIRAAWLYYVEGMTQSDVADTLNVSRIMINLLKPDHAARSQLKSLPRWPRLLNCNVVLNANTD